MRIFQKYTIFFVFLLVLPAVWALLHPGLPPTHDGEYHVIRFYEFDKVLRAGYFYPRWAPDLNNQLGVPLFNYVYPFPNYFASLLHTFGFSFIDALKLNMFFATIIGSLFFYLWTKLWWGKGGALLSSVFYTYAPYRFVDIYIRGSVGEVWALAFLPAFLWAITRLYHSENKLFVLLASIFFACMIFSHNILGLMFTLFSVSYICLLLFQAENKKDVIRKSLLVFIFGIGLSAIFWFPALYETKYVTGLQIYTIRENFAQLYQLLIPSWGSGFSPSDLGNEMSLQIGVANLLGFFITLCLLFKRKLQEKKIILFLQIWFIIVFFLMIKQSLFIWETIPLFNYFQFPWRFLSLEIVVASFLAGSLTVVGKTPLERKMIMSFFIILSIILCSGYMYPAFYHMRDDAYYVSRENFIHGTNSPGDLFNTIWLGSQPKIHDIPLTLENDKIKSIKSDLLSQSYQSSIEEKTEFTARRAYFPAWKLTIDNKDSSVYNNKGLVAFSIPAGKHLIRLFYGKTTIEKTAEVVFVISIVGLCMYVYLGRKRYS